MKKSQKSQQNSLRKENMSVKIGKHSTRNITIGEINTPIEKVDGVYVEVSGAKSVTAQRNILVNSLFPIPQRVIQAMHLKPFMKNNGSEKFLIFSPDIMSEERTTNPSGRFTYFKNLVNSIGQQKTKSSS